MGTRINKAGKTVPRRLNMGLGPCQEVSLAEARDKAREVRKQIRDGIVPLEKNTPVKRFTKLRRVNKKPSVNALKLCWKSKVMS